MKGLTPHRTVDDTRKTFEGDKKTKRERWFLWEPISHDPTNATKAHQTHENHFHAHSAACDVLFHTWLFNLEAKHVQMLGALD